MFTTCYKRQIEIYLDREEEQVGTGRCIQHTKNDRSRVTQIERRRRQVQVDMYRTCNIRKRDDQIEKCVEHVTINR